MDLVYSFQLLVDVFSRLSSGCLSQAHVVHTPPDPPWPLTMEHTFGMKLLNAEEMQLERDFLLALKQYGIDQRHILKYEKEEKVQENIG